MASKFITVSIEILQDKNLTANEKFVLAEIEQLCSLEHGCYASNQHFADLIGIGRTNASRTITNLENKGYISCVIKMGTRNRERVINLIKGCTQNDNTVLSKCLESKENIQENIQDNKKNTKKEENDLPENLNKEAFDLWITYKGSSYSKQGKTLSANKLAKYSHDVQMQMVENSIMNNYKGLFEPKENNQTGFKKKEAQVGSINWEMQQAQKNNSSDDVIDVDEV